MKSIHPVLVVTFVVITGCQQPVAVEELAPAPAAPAPGDSGAVHAVQGGAPSGVFPTGHPAISGPGAKLPAGHPPVEGAGGSAAPSKEMQVFSGPVKEMAAAGRYQYLQIETPSGRVWTAVPSGDVKVADVATVERAVEMKGFHSKTLNRTFESVWFGTLAGASDAPGEASASPPAVPELAPSDDAPAPAAGEASASSGKPMTIDRLYAIRSTLQGKPVLVKGKVVKFNGGIMGRNWVHIQDGTGDSEKGTHDLLVTTDQVVEVDDTVSFKGIVINDKDFGMGYRYDVLVEQATKAD